MGGVTATPRIIDFSQWYTWPCDEWPGTIAAGGYGIRKYRRFRPGKGGRTWKAHRAEWDEKRGPIPRGLLALHRCDNPPCYEIEHLFLGTQADNVSDMMEKGRGRWHTGEMNANSKLTQDKADEIRRWYAEGGVTHRSLALEYGISHSQIGNILRHKRW